MLGEMKMISHRGHQGSERFSQNMINEMISSLMASTFFTMLSNQVGLNSHLDSFLLHQSS